MIILQPKRIITLLVVVSAVCLFFGTLLKLDDSKNGNKFHNSIVSALQKTTPTEAPAEFYRIRETLEDNYVNIKAHPPIPARRNMYYGADKIEPNLLIGFGRNWFMLQQCIVSYLAAGWPAHHITIVDNSGVMDSNIQMRLSPSNPSYVNYTRLAELGVNYQRTPALLTFSQLQNYYISLALENGWDYYLWGHMDVVVFSDESTTPYKSFYQNILDDIRPTIENLDNWALHFYKFDWLTLVNTKSYNLLGGFDPAIPYYTSDCDFYSRIGMYGQKYGNGFKLVDVEIPFIWDLADELADLSVFFPAPPSSEHSTSPVEEEPLLSPRYLKLRATLEDMRDKKVNSAERNTWQQQQTGGQDEPYFRGSWVLNDAFWAMNDLGREMFEKKWHTGGICPVIETGKTLDDMYVQ